jgi:hypothetical protein
MWNRRREIRGLRLRLTPTGSRPAAKWQAGPRIGSIVGALISRRHGRRLSRRCVRSGGGVFSSMTARLRFSGLGTIDPKSRSIYCRRQCSAFMRKPNHRKRRRDPATKKAAMANIPPDAMFTRAKGADALSDLGYPVTKATLAFFGDPRRWPNLSPLRKASALPRG